MTAAELFGSSEAIVFDLDGTLVDTLPDLTATLNQALLELGLGKVDTTLVRLSLHGGFEESARAALAVLGHSDELMEGLVNAYAHHYWRAPALHSRPYPGVRELLTRQQGRGVRMAVCTNKTEALAGRLLDVLDLRRHFVAVVGADTCSRRKPDPEPLWHAINCLQTSRERAIFVGDSRVDVDCAKAAQVRCLYFRGGYGSGSAESGLADQSFGAYSGLAVLGKSLCRETQHQQDCSNGNHSG